MFPRSSRLSDWFRRHSRSPGFATCLLVIGLVGCQPRDASLADDGSSRAGNGDGSGVPAEFPVVAGIADLGDARIEYFVQGQGRPIVLLPGGGLSTEYLRPLALELARAGHQAIRINPRGAGESRGPSESVTLHRLAADVIGVLDALEVDRADIAGHAFGNRVARTVEHDAPERVRSVILLAAGGVVEPAADAARALGLVFDPDATDEQILEAMRYMVGDPDDAASSWALLRPSRFPAAAAVVGIASQTPDDSWARPSGRNPMLVVQGTADQVAPRENGEILKQELGDLVDLVDIPGGGHLMVINHASETTAAILSFLDSTFE